MPPILAISTGPRFELRGTIPTNKQPPPGLAEVAIREVSFWLLFQLVEGFPAL
jgi:hypothetical protein